MIVDEILVEMRVNGRKSAIRFRDVHIDQIQAKLGIVSGFFTRQLQERAELLDVQTLCLHLRTRPEQIPVYEYSMPNNKAELVGWRPSAHRVCLDCLAKVPAEHCSDQERLV